MRREGWTEPLWEGSPGLLNVLGSGARQGSSHASWIRGQQTPDGKGGGQLPRGLRGKTPPPVAAVGQ